MDDGSHLMESDLNMKCGQTLGFLKSPHVILMAAKLREPQLTGFQLKLQYDHPDAQRA